MSDDFIVRFPRPIDKKAQLQRWARAYFSDRLRAEGFISYHNEDLSWYRVINGEVLQAVYLYTDWQYIPIMPKIGVGVHPLFVEAPIPQKHYLRGEPDTEVMNRIPLPGSVKQMDDETLIACPNTPLGGGERLDEVIFPMLSTLTTTRDSYEFYINGRPDIRKLYLHPGTGRGILITPNLIDMAIYEDDKSFYPDCIERLHELLKLDLFGRYWTEKDVQRTQMQWRAIVDGERNVYLDALEERKKQFIKKLNKKLGIKA